MQSYISFQPELFLYFFLFTSTLPGRALLPSQSISTFCEASRLPSSNLHRAARSRSWLARDIVRTLETFCYHCLALVYHLLDLGCMRTIHSIEFRMVYHVRVVLTGSTLNRSNKQTMIGLSFVLELEMRVQLGAFCLPPPRLVEVLHGLLSARRP
jgi:hypothetical protein